MTGRFLKLQQAPGVAEQHLAIVGQSDAACCPPEQGPFGLELKPFDLLAYRRLGQVEPFGGAVETAGIGHGDEGAQQFEIQHTIDPISRSMILLNIVSIINDDLLSVASRAALSEGDPSCQARHDAEKIARPVSHGLPRSAAPAEKSAVRTAGHHCSKQSSSLA